MSTQQPSNVPPIDDWNQLLAGRVAVVTGGGSGDLVSGAAERVLEEGEEQFVLAVKVLVEAAQRLAGAIDDFLYGEVGGALLGDDHMSCVEEPLDALLGTDLGGAGGPFDRSLLPCRLIPGRDHERIRVLRDDTNPTVRIR